MFMFHATTTDSWCFESIRQCGPVYFEKLSKYGILGVELGFVIIVLIWISMYSNHKSQRETITCGVPRCSILIPLLFLLYINELTNVSRYCFFVSQFSSLTIPICLYLGEIYIFCIINWMKISEKYKGGWVVTNYCLMFSRLIIWFSHHEIEIEVIDLELHGVIIQRAFVTKFWGPNWLLFNLEISYWKQHIPATNYQNVLAHSARPD